MNRNNQLFKTFALASTVTFSGGLASVPMLHEIFVIKHQYLSTEDFYHYVSLGQSIPGVTAVTTASLLGYKINNRKGQFFACFGAILPVLVIMSLLTMLYTLIPQTGVISYIMAAVRATAGVFIFEAVLDMAPVIIRNDHIKLLITLALTLFLYLLPGSTVYVIMLCLVYSVYGFLAHGGHYD